MTLAVEKPHLMRLRGVWVCLQRATLTGDGYTWAEAWADWKERNRKK